MRRVKRHDGGDEMTFNQTHRHHLVRQITRQCIDIAATAAIDLRPNYSLTLDQQKLRIHLQAGTVILNAPLQHVGGRGILRNSVYRNAQLARVQLTQNRNGLGRDCIAKGLIGKSLVLEWLNTNGDVARCRC